MEYADVYAGHVCWLLDDLSAGLTHDAVVDDMVDDH
jgi:hypothetical protein